MTRLLTVLMIMAGLSVPAAAQDAIAKGFTVVDDKAGLDGITKADQNNPVLGLFNDGNMTVISCS